MKKCFLVVTILMGFIFCYAQDDEPTSAPKINPFSLKGDNLGAIANSVNLYTGDLNLPLNLVSLSGNGALGVDVSIMYSSASIENLDDVWNLDAPTGVLGLGWTLAYPMIVVDNKSTGSRDDDEFYLIEGGVSTRLFCIANNSGVKTYKTKTYTNWVVKFTPSSEKWEITKEDGTKYIYGDQNSGRNTVQWIVKWSNWIGNSNVASNQRQGLVWNLSEIKNIWGEKLTYSYLNDENVVGAGSTHHTEASYLSKVSDSWGREVELVYKNKLAAEYADPHTELPEPDAYQERYEKKYLDKLLVKIDGISYYEVQCKYVTNLLGTGNLTKRLLKSITHVSPTGEQIPVTFDYLTTGDMRGSLNKVTSHAGGSVEFTYGITSRVQTQMVATAPSGYAEPQVFMGPDYHVITWRQYNGVDHVKTGKEVQAYVYSWEGRWVESSLGSIGNVELMPNDDQDYLKEWDHDYLTATGRDFFAILRPVYNTNNHTLYIFHKSDVLPGTWISNTYTIDLGTHDPKREQIFAGNNFIVVSNNNGKLFRYVWDGNSWRSDVITETTGTHFTTVNNNYLISHNTVPNPDAVTMYYLDELSSWQTRTFGNTFNNGSGSSYWHGSNNFAVVMANGSNEFIYNWDENYNNITRVDKGLSYTDHSFVYVSDATMGIIALNSADNSFKGRVLRYNGNTWIDLGEKTSQTRQAAVGEDVYVQNNWKMYESPFTSVNGYYTFNANTNSWSNETQVVNTNGLVPTINVGINYFTVDKSLFFKQPGGYTETTSALSFDYDVTPVSGRYIAGNPAIYSLKSGVPYTGLPMANNNCFKVRYSTSHQNYRYMVSPTTIVGCSPSFKNDFLNATSLQMTLVTSQFSNTLVDFPVKLITINDSYKTFFTTVIYDDTNVLGDENTSFYNKVTVIPGVSNELTKPFGYTENYFFNGRSQTELANTIPYDGGLGNAPWNYKLLLGQRYKTKVFNSTSTLVSETSITWNLENTVINNSSSIAVGKAYLPRQYKVNAIQDGIEVVTQNGFNSTTKQLNYQRIHTESANGDDKEVMESEIIYAHEVYPSCASKNILSPVVQTKRKINGNIYTESVITRWKDWPCSGPNCIYTNVPSPVDQYAWKSTNTSNFTWWDVTTQTPSSDWIFKGKTLTRDNSCGIELETQGVGNQLNCLLLDQTKRNVVAAISNSVLSKVAHSSFEQTENSASGNWTSWEAVTPTVGNSKTGERYLVLGTTGITKSGLSNSESYTVSFWAKSTNGSITIDGIPGIINLGNIASWSLFEYIVTGVSSITLKRSGTTEVQIDEVRIYPTNARITTSTHHSLFGPTSNTSSNNQTMYTEYDNVGRVKNRLDQNRDIVQTILYNFKK
ncbi:hypothetical protein [Chryseolinea sp. H1M3-3]|uniref:hypothetical protein n=1 Tax=Chryseolinea sp. H1M3-3 TaxID=3034144 RepID=UPI0023EB194D|nr:hypothetical protein [Chryseolinea sp. H1M3-3]